MLTEGNVDYNYAKGGSVRHVALLFLILTGTAFAKVWVVDTTGAEGDSLQKAIDSAWQDPGIDTVLVKNGTYHLFINDTIGLIMRDSVVLMSENGAEKCTLTAVSEDGTDTAWHVIYCSGWDTASHAAIIKGFTIKDGNATGPSTHKHGGGIFISRASPTIDSCIIINNYASYDGGGIYIYSYSSPTLKSNTITNNHAYDDGGGICISDCSSPIVNSCIISNNSASDDGGGIYIYYHSSPTIDSCVITNNSASDNGGGIYIYYYSSPVLKGNTIINNSASNGGGGIYICDNSSPALSGNMITNNSANYGGGIYIYYYSSPTIDSCIISNNSATYDGGGIYIDYYSLPVLEGNTITNNSASDDGGGIYIEDHSSLTIDSCIITHNSASDGGGGIYIYYYSSPTLKGNAITNNSANKGGGIYIYDHSSPTLSGNIIESNSADAGGGVYIYNSTPTLKGNTIYANSSELSGGGIYIYYYSSPVLQGNIIYNNSAGLKGGGIRINRHSSLTSIGNIIYSNSADSGGGGLAIRNYSQAKLMKCVIGMNKSVKGGAIFDTLYSKVIIDSSFIVDNGDYSNAGLAYIASNADSGITFKLTYSHIYYNTLQPDTEIVNLSGVTINLENNFWWDTTDAEISAKIYGANVHTPWSNDFIPGVPGEPVSIDSLKNYDKDFSQVVNSLDKEDTLYIRIYGEDRNAHLHEIAVVIIKSSVYPQGIAVGLVETDTNSGIYEGIAYVLESTGNEDIRDDDINQIIRVDPAGDDITLQSNIDITKKFIVKYKGGLPQPDIALSDTMHDFGTSSLYDTIDWKMWVKNAGNETLSVDSVKVNLPFKLISPSLPQIILPGDSTEFTVRFNPQDTGNFVDTMKIYSNDPDEPVAKVVLIASCVGLQEILPKTFKVSNMPNPFSNFTQIKYQLPEEEKVKIEIIDITGRLIKVLVDEKKSPGYYSVTWKGKDTQGRNVPPGIYFYLIKAGKNRAIKKMIKLK